MSDRYKSLHKQAQKLMLKKRACLNKVAYETKELAFQKGQESYKCKYCGKWHRTGKISKLISTIRKK